MTLEEAVEQALQRGLEQRRRGVPLGILTIIRQIILEDLLENDPDDYEHGACYTLNLPEYYKELWARYRAEEELKETQVRAARKGRIVELIGEDNKWKLP